MVPSQIESVEGLFRSGRTPNHARNFERRSPCGATPFKWLTLNASGALRCAATPKVVGPTIDRQGTIYAASRTDYLYQATLL